MPGTIHDLSVPWRGVGPFLFAVHHLDKYPNGNGDMGPHPDLLKGRQIGMDMGNASGTGWNMYHGKGIPGFPSHGHRGIETISYVRQGFIDHADSTNACARYGRGDTQWVTTGRGVSHSEMFPLLDDEHPNPMELYQVWLNLPAKSKMAPPQFLMFWREETPVVKKESVGGVATVAVVTGAFEDVTPLTPPTASWASEPDSDVAMWVIDLEPGAAIKLPAPKSDKTERMLYVHGGDGVRVTIAGMPVDNYQAYQPEMGTGPEHKLMVKNVTRQHATVLLLQGVPIGEPVAQQGPFVMNTKEELAQAVADYRATRFGPWKWESDQPVHPKEEGRFADYGDGKVYPPVK